MHVAESYAYTQARLMNERMKTTPRHIRMTGSRRWVRRTK